MIFVFGQIRHVWSHQGGLTISTVKVEIRKARSDNLWGKLDIKATMAAMGLSGEAFKLWVRLALNQDGFISTIDRGQFNSELSELLDAGYLIASDSAMLLFIEEGGCDNVQENQPLQWDEVYSLYNKTVRNTEQDLEYVTERLTIASIEDELDSVLTYWVSKYPDLASSRPAKAKNALRYDFAKVLVWYLWEHFTFELGDVVVVGKEGRRIRCHNDAVKARIVDGAKARSIESVTMQERNIQFWQDAFAKRQIELSLSDIGDIIRARKDLKHPLSR